MASLLTGKPSCHGAHDGNFEFSREKSEDVGGRWYFSWKEIEEESPSIKDGIDLKKETYLRKSYCTFLQDLGMRLVVPQVTIATAIVFCHCFFLRQSHAKNDRRTIATACMFLAGKVEETPHPLNDVILVSYEIVHKKDPAAKQRIRQKEVYEQQKELMLLGERVVLGTLGYDLNVHHPYKPLVEAIKKFEVAQNALTKVAWNFVNDGLRTSLCLQFKPHHIAAAVSNQLLELYEQFRPSLSVASDCEAKGSAGDVKRRALKAPAGEEHTTIYNSSHGGATSNIPSVKAAPSRPGSFGPPRTTPAQTGSSENNSIPDCRGEDEIHKQEDTPQQGKPGNGDDNQETYESEPKNKYHGKNMPNKDVRVGELSQDVTKKLDREKLKAAFARRKAQGDITRQKDTLDELERELEDIEVPGEQKQSWVKPPRPQQEFSESSKSNNEDDFDTVEEGEVELSDEVERAYRLPRKRKAGSPMDRNGLGRHDYSERDHKRQARAGESCVK